VFALPRHQSLLAGIGNYPDGVWIIDPILNCPDGVWAMWRVSNSSVSVWRIAWDLGEWCLSPHSMSLIQ